MTLTFWTDLWWYWLLCIAVSFVALEGASIIYAHKTDQLRIEDYTLSDTIRRWAKTWRPLAAIVSGVVLGLLVHWFVTPNPGV